MIERLLFKKIECWILLLVIIALLGTSIVFSYVVQGTIRGYDSIGVIGDYAVKISESPRLVRQVISQIFFDNKYLSKLPNDLVNKINIFPEQSNSRHLGLISFYEQKEKNGKGKFLLKDIETGKIIKEWRNIEKSPNAISFYDDTLIVSGERGIQDSTDSLSKVGKYGQIIWKKEISAHHLTYVDSTGKVYTPIIMSEATPVSHLLKSRDKYRDDGYAILSPAGEIIQERSVTQILLDNNLGYLILGVGPLEKDAIHLNAVKPAEQSSDYWQKGDLLLSLRHLSLVMIYRPSNNKVIWYQLGPWLNQHDPNFISNHQISVFGNDVVSSYFNRTSEDAPFWGGGDNIYLYDFIDNKTYKPFIDITSKVKYKTVTGGQQTIFRDGSFFIIYTEAGIAVFYDKMRNNISYFASLEGNFLRRENGINAYTWETYKMQRNND